MKASVVLLLLVLVFVGQSLAGEDSITAKQIITTCIQKGDTPCAVGVDKRTIIINKKNYNFSDNTEGSKLVAVDT